VNGDGLPPILQYAEFYSFSLTDDVATLLFRQDNPALGPVGVQISLSAVSVQYTYSYFDQDSRVIHKYQGPYGDPTKDDMVDLHGA